MGWKGGVRRSRLLLQFAEGGNRPLGRDAVVADLEYSPLGAHRDRPAAGSGGWLHPIPLSQRLCPTHSPSSLRPDVGLSCPGEQGFGNLGATHLRSD